MARFSPRDDERCPGPSHEKKAGAPQYGCWTHVTDFDTAYRQHYDAVRGFLYRLGAREPDLRDLVQETFATAMRRWPSFDASRPVRPWLLGIAFRTHADERARARHGREELTGEIDAAADDDPERAASHRQRRRLLEDALNDIEPARRAAFLLHHVEGLSPQEVAEQMETPLATTYTRLRTARLELTAAMQRLEGGGA